jgi:hypothetical protein
MGGIERKPARGLVPRGAGTSAERAGAQPLSYSFDMPCMEGVLDRMPERLRRAVAEHVDLAHLPANRWYADCRHTLFRFFAFGHGVAVLASQNAQESPVRRVFPFEPTTLLELGPDVRPPVPAPADDERGPDGAAAGPLPEDAPDDWADLFAQFPFETQRLFEDVFPPSRRATRFVAACMAHDHSRERIWAFAGTKREALLVFGDRHVPVDPFSSQATERRLRRAPWSVTAWRAQGSGRPSLATPTA